MSARAADSGVRLAELMAALSIATDLGMGQPLETALCSCVVAMRLGEVLRLDDATLRDVYYQALLRYIGCNAETYALAALVGDELALRRDFAAVDPGQPPEVLELVVRYLRRANAGASPSRLEEIIAHGLLTLPRLTHESFAGHCEVAQRLAGRLGLADSLMVCLGQLYERWDGKGQPRGRCCGCWPVASPTAIWPRSSTSRPIPSSTTFSTSTTRPASPPVPARRCLPWSTACCKTAADTAACSKKWPVRAMLAPPFRRTLSL